MALNKPILLLKDDTLDTLHADLLGNLYVNFYTDRLDKISLIVNSMIKQRLIHINNNGSVTKW